MKICVMGNSHLAALKLAWDELVTDYNQVELVFFGARANAMTHLKEENGCLVPTNDRTKQDILFTSNGLELVDFTYFDAVLLYGLACDVRIFSSTLQNHKIDKNADSSRQFMTRDCFSKVCQDGAEHSLLFKMATMVRRLTDLPLIVSSSPFPSRACVDDASHNWDFLVNDDSEMIRQGYDDGIQRAFRVFQAKVIPQPERTVTDNIFTKTHYSNASVRLIEGFTFVHPENDHAHMNKDYGVEYLKDIFNMISLRSVEKKHIPLLSVKDAFSALERFQKASVISENNVSIPLRVFQYWDTDIPPEQVQTLINRNRYLCKMADIEYVLLNDSDARDCIRKHFSEEVYKAYDISPHPAMKCDLFRLCYLYQYGGFYLDADMVLTEKFLELFAIKGELVVFKWDSQNITGVCNWLIGSVPQCPVIDFAISTVSKSIINACKNNVENILKQTLGISGPALFTRVLGSYIASKENHPDFSILPIGVAVVSYAFSLVQNGTGFLKTALSYKTTNLHWSVAAKSIDQDE